MLFPQSNEVRETNKLDGLWAFKKDERGNGVELGWYKSNLLGSTEMAVPASYNDITQDPSLRDHIGLVWYERTFFVPQTWKNKRVWLRFGSVTHHATVWLNGQELGSHKGGFLPFEFEITAHYNSGKENRLSVVVDNRLDYTCLPTGTLIPPSDSIALPKQETFFDFFNYAGIHRSVTLYTTPQTKIQRIRLQPNIDLKRKTGTLLYSVDVDGATHATTAIRVIDETNNCVAVGSGFNGSITIKNPCLWNPGKAYLYTFEIRLDSDEGDLYRENFGFRSIEIQGKQFLVNGEPFYFKGFGKHEDMDINGRGFDMALMLKDFNLLDWIGANSFRTAHYPYAEETLQLADKRGILVIDELPAVGMNFWHPHKPEEVFNSQVIGDATLAHHLDTLNATFERDYNHPCVVMWSLANEAATYEKSSRPYFETLFKRARELDSSRPITIVQSSLPTYEAWYPVPDLVGDLCDVICFNRYYAWYSEPGQLAVAEARVTNEITGWWEKYGKPVLCAEYGADTIAGLHQEPAIMFSEEYQCAILECYHKAFDKCDFMIGEHVWNFADFATKQAVNRVAGNKKGVFTRQRQPKMAAHILRARWRRDT